MSPDSVRSRRMKTLLAVLIGIWLSAVLVSPLHAHEEHRREQQRAAQVAAQARGPQLSGVGAASAQSMHENMDATMMETGKDRAQMSFVERLADWLGRTHTVLVHFPIAFFPAALFTAIVGRRRPAFGAPVQFLVVAGGIIAPISALFGWFNAGFSLSDPDPLLMLHRWLGSAIGIGGMLLAIWAWRRPGEDRSTGMIIALLIMTIVIIVQGWFGGALVHGAEHMNW